MKSVRKDVRLWFIGATALWGISYGVGLLNRAAIAQAPGTQIRSEPIVLVSTADDTAAIRDIPGYRPRFSQILGSGALLVNANNQVTGYYFTTTGLQPSQTLPYHFHSARNGAISTSCEGDKELIPFEAPGEVITDLSAIAPLQSTAGGVGIIGSSISPVQLPNPVPLSDIGYLNIHLTQGDGVGPGVVCANVRLNPGGFERQ